MPGTFSHTMEEYGFIPTMHNKEMFYIDDTLITRHGVMGNNSWDWHLISDSDLGDIFPTFGDHAYQCPARPSYPAHPTSKPTSSEHHPTKSSFLPTLPPHRPCSLSKILCLVSRFFYPIYISPKTLSHLSPPLYLALKENFLTHSTRFHCPPRPFLHVVNENTSE